MRVISSLDASGTNAGPPRPRGRIRAAQRELTRTRLVDAAIEAFKESGYAHTTVDDIAGRAGTTRATFYLHFKSKAAIIAVLQDRNREHFQGVWADMGPVAHAPSVKSVRKWIAHAMHDWETVRDLSRPIAEAASIEPEVHKSAVQRDANQITELAAALRSGVPDLNSRDAEIFASILLAPLRYYFDLYVRGERFNKKRVIDAMAASWMAVFKKVQEHSVAETTP
jgi:AcrR family transcriptional regulator